MAAKLRAATAARRDPDFVLIARTDARGVSGFADAVKRAHESLLTASNEFTRRLYENVQAQQSGAAGGAAGDNAQSSDDEVADAEIIDDDQQSA